MPTRYPGAGDDLEQCEGKDRCPEKLKEPKTWDSKVGCSCALFLFFEEDGQVRRRDSRMPPDAVGDDMLLLFIKINRYNRLFCELETRGGKK